MTGWQTRRSQLNRLVTTLPTAEVAIAGAVLAPTTAIAQLITPVKTACLSASLALQASGHHTEASQPAVPKMQGSRTAPCWARNGEEVASFCHSQRMKQVLVHKGSPFQFSTLTRHDAATDSLLRQLMRGGITMELLILSMARQIALMKEYQATKTKRA